MANVATLVVSLAFGKGNISTRPIASGSVARDVAGSRAIYNVQTVGTSAEAVLLGDVGTPGLAIVHNLDATNFAEVLDSVAGAACVKLKAGDWALFRFTTATPAFKADTAPVDLEYWLLPN